MKTQEERIKELEAQLEERERKHEYELWELMDEVGSLKHHLISAQEMLYRGISQDHKIVIKNMVATTRFFDTSMSALIRYGGQYNSEVKEVISIYYVECLVDDGFLSAFDEGDAIWAGGEPYLDFIEFKEEVELWIKYNN